MVTSPTEARNDRTRDIDTLPTLDVLRLINAEDQRVAPAVAALLPDLATVVDEAARRYRSGGRVHYFGAGTSGRLALLDAAELGPTFSVEPDRVVAHHAGGSDAQRHARESAEDADTLGAADAAVVGPQDVVLGLTASGRTPYVRGALQQASRIGAYRVLVSANPDAPLGDLADVHLAVDTGAEAVAGSTRMKAGTAQKLVLNAFSTALMVRLGKTYSNLMVDVAAANDKLRGRTVRILMEASGAGQDECDRALAGADGVVKVALVMLLAGASATQARAGLERAGGVVRDALALMDGGLHDGSVNRKESP